MTNWLNQKRSRQNINMAVERCSHIILPANRYATILPRPLPGHFTGLLRASFCDVKATLVQDDSDGFGIIPDRVQAPHGEAP